MIKLLLVDDSPLYLKSLEMLFAREKNVKLVGSCCDGSEVIPFLKNQEVDAIILDIMMKKMNGIETAKLVNEMYPSIKIFSLSTDMNKFYKKMLLKAGVAACFYKDDNPKEMIKAINFNFSYL